MEMLLIIALLASNVWLIRKVLTKPDTPAEDDRSVKQPSPETAADPEPPADVVGKSTFNVGEFMDSFREIAKEAATEAAREVVPLIIKELGTPSDAGLPETPVQTNLRQVPNEKLDEVFKTMSASELTGEMPPPAEPNAEGVDFEEMQSAMKVLKDQPHTAEDERIARRVVPELEGTEIIEYVKLDPVVRKRILMIECHLPEMQDEAAPDKPDSIPADKARKIVFHADIDTTDVDAIDFNILH